MQCNHLSKKNVEIIVKRVPTTHMHREQVEEPSHLNEDLSKDVMHFPLPHTLAHLSPPETDKQGEKALLESSSLRGTLSACLPFCLRQSCRHRVLIIHHALG